jgi:hypothetical protein
VRPGSRVYAAAFLRWPLDSSLNQRRVHERAVLHLTKRPNGWFVSASSAAESPYFSIVWRKRKTEAWSGGQVSLPQTTAHRSDGATTDPEPLAGFGVSVFPTGEELVRSADALRFAETAGLERAVSMNQRPGDPRTEPCKPLADS